jgi:hypothetical protein
MVTVWTSPLDWESSSKDRMPMHDVTTRIGWTGSCGPPELFHRHDECNLAIPG